MARTHGKILCTIWQDEDFLARSSAAQRLYMVVVSQAKVNLAGLLDYRPKQLASLAPDTSIDDVEDALDELVAHRFLIVDPITDEILIRSFTRSDPVNMANPKLRKGIWSAWLAIESRTLREEAIRNMPDDLFGFDDVPPAAARIRTSQRMEPVSDPPPDSPPDPVISEPVTDSVTDPSATSTSTATVTGTAAARPAGSTPVDNIGATTLPDGTRHITGTGKVEPYTPPDPITDDERAAGLAEARRIRQRLRPTGTEDHPE